ncbi:MAG: hypothetical protein KDB71_13030 [Mycobacterium sp.]|nr:hypothetical protein [Mycobacterium sp.]
MTTEPEQKKAHHRDGRTWPGFLFGGRVRTSTLALVVAFFAIWWIYVTYQPAPHPREQVPAADIVPPGYIPDPSYTWVPRTDVQQRTTTSATPTTPTTTTPTDTTTSSTSGSESSTPTTASSPPSSDQSASSSDTTQSSTPSSTASMVPLPPLIHPTVMPSRSTSASPTS